MTPTLAHSSRARQRGVAFYLFIVMVVAAAAATLLATRGLVSAGESRDKEAQRTLQEARRAVLAYLAAPDLDASGRRLGEWRLFPDLPIAAGAGNDAAEPVYDGLAETGGCAWRGWSPGQPLQAQASAAAAARCFGRLPWRDLGLTLPEADPTDAAGLVPWVYVSPNLMTQSACLADLNPLVLAQPFITYACLGAAPYPWITVVDERGNVLSNRVAFAMILPGPALPGQVRGPAAGPSAYLDRVTIGAGCPAPCQPGTYDNANFNHADNQPTVLIRAPYDATAAQRQGYFSLPYQFNDRLVYVTIDELLGVLERRARQELMHQLTAFKTGHGYFPFAAPLSSTTGDCLPLTRLGHPAVQPGLCGATEALSLPNWWLDAGWHRYFVYSVSPRCIQGSNACNAPGLVVGADNSVNALLIGPGTAIQTLPFAPSKLIAQMPLVGFLLSPLPGDYLDTIENAGGAPDVFEVTAGLPAPSNDRLDIVN